MNSAIKHFVVRAPFNLHVVDIGPQTSTSDVANGPVGFLLLIKNAKGFQPCSSMKHLKLLYQNIY